MSSFPRRASICSNSNIRPLLSFALLADVQYADQPPLGALDYRGSWDRLARAVEAINQTTPAFTIQLGDLIDGGAGSLARILPLYEALTMPRYHLLGNHDFVNGRAELMRMLGMESAWYDFALGSWRFVVLDAMDISVAGRAQDTPEYAAAVAMLASLRERHVPNANDWNGAVGETQLQWLREGLRQAREQKQRVIVFCHLPALPQSSNPLHVAWNGDQICATLDESGVVVAYMNGHAHEGGYAERRGIHYVTFPGMVESGAANSYTMVDVFDDRLELHGTGTAPSRTLALAAPSPRS